VTDCCGLPEKKRFAGEMQKRFRGWPIRARTQKEETARIMRTVSLKRPHQDGQGYVP
jgi:hypothetical protein